MSFELHYYPGRFGEGVRGLVERLIGGSTAFRLDRLTPALGPGADEHRAASTDVAAAWLVDAARGEARSAFAAFKAPNGSTYGAVLTVRGLALDRRVAALAFPGDDGIKASDAELALLGATCAALAKESQGAGLIGGDLGDPGRFGEDGSVADQVRAALDHLGGKVLVVLAAPDTAASLDELDGFWKRSFVGLVEYRRTMAVD
ncbi:MAG TPA: hypothetical protein VEI02_04860 [Planctomycetota bacterium]|nr:hypothetical protein [Planctomycetota bacterium]